jgi:hypothetical protein
MQATGVLATSKAATRSVRDAQQESATALSSMRKYAALLGEDEEAAETLAEGAEILRFMAAPAAPAGKRQAKAATHAAMRRHRGSKDFDKK